MPKNSGKNLEKYSYFQVVDKHVDNPNSCNSQLVLGRKCSAQTNRHFTAQNALSSHPNAFPNVHVSSCPLKKIMVWNIVFFDASVAAVSNAAQYKFDIIRHLCLHFWHKLKLLIRLSDSASFSSLLTYAFRKGVLRFDVNLTIRLRAGDFRMR